MNRRYFIWDPHAGVFLRGCYYLHLRNAHDAALKQVRWSKVNRTLEIIDRETSKEIGQYTRKLHSVLFTKGV